MKRAPAELAIRLQRKGESIAVELRFANLDEGEILPKSGSTSIDEKELLEHLHEPTQYGEILTKSLFSAADIQEHYSLYMGRLGGGAHVEPVRIRIFVDQKFDDPLHQIRWELLRDPISNAPMGTSRHQLLSRLLGATDWRPIRLRPKGTLRALIAVSAPTDLETEWPPLAPLDRDAEIARAEESLEGVQVVAIRQPAVFEILLEVIKAHSPDILYLVCHGSFDAKEGTKLLLQDSSGAAELRAGSHFVERLGGLDELPRLVILASCESAGRDAASPGALAPLAFQLAQTGVPAVVAMRGKITVDTVSRAMPVFFKELLRDGQIDRAMAEARWAVRDTGDDFWMPALYLRLTRGRIWSDFGVDEKDDLKKWTSIVGRVSNGQFTPILGPDVGECFYGQTSDWARQLSDEFDVPLAGHQREDLPRVLQYLRQQLLQTEGPEALKLAFKKQICQSVVEKRGQALLPEGGEHWHDLPDMKNPAVLGHLLKAAAGLPGEDGELNPYQILAKLPARIYVTVCADNLLKAALDAEPEKTPQLYYSQWRRGAIRAKKEVDEPDQSRPLIYHVFGYAKEGDEDTLVLTEDDYFDYLIGTSSNKPPAVVKNATVSTSLLFLGFKLSDWSFRVLFRLIMNQQGVEQLKEFTHIAVQLDPRGHSASEARRARDFLESYFDEKSIDIYWGTTSEFLKDLYERCQPQPKGVPDGF